MINEIIRKLVVIVGQEWLCIFLLGTLKFLTFIYLFYAKNANLPRISLSKDFLGHSHHIHKVTMVMLAYLLFPRGGSKD